MKYLMRHFRVFHGAVQHLDAERCDLTERTVVFSLSKIVIKSFNIADVTLVEELDDGLRPKKVIFRMPSLGG